MLGWWSAAVPANPIQTPFPAMHRGSNSSATQIPESPPPPRAGPASANDGVSIHNPACRQLQLGVHPAMRMLQFGVAGARRKLKVALAEIAGRSRFPASAASLWTYNADAERFVPIRPAKSRHGAHAPSRTRLAAIAKRRSSQLTSRRSAANSSALPGRCVGRTALPTRPKPAP